MEQITFSSKNTSLGFALIAESSKGICTVILASSKRAAELELRRTLSGTVLIERSSRLSRRALKYIDGVGVPERIPLDMRGTQFQRRVWRKLMRIPIGRTTSYSALAAQLRMPQGARAVASACAANNIAVLIPCHRVIRKQGGHSGYRWGVSRKKALLVRERSRGKNNAA